MEEPTGPLASGKQQDNLKALGRLIDEARRDLRDGTVDPALLKSLGMTKQQFSAFVERYNQRIGKIAKMQDTTAGPDGAIRGNLVIPGSAGTQAGRGVDERMEPVRGGEKLRPDEQRKLYEQRARKVSQEYRKDVEAYFRAISEGQGGAGRE